jgi:hypothetical protein
MSERYQPKIDDTTLCTEEDFTKYRSIIGCLIWIFLLGRFDYVHTTSAMSRFNISTREENLKAI